VAAEQMEDENEHPELAALDGATFRQAFQNYAIDDDDVLVALREAQNEVPNLHGTMEGVGPLYRYWRWPTLIDADAKATSLCAPRRDRLQKTRPMFERPRMTAALSETVRRSLWLVFVRFNAFTDLLRGGFLGGRGFVPGTSDSVKIPVGDWWAPDASINLKTGDFGISVAGRWECRYGSVMLYRPRVDPSQLGGLSPASAFYQIVRKDPAVKELAAHVESHSQVDARIALQGGFWGGFYQDKQNWWPVCLDDMAVLPDGTMSYENQFMSAVADRLGQMLRPLRTGEVKAEGLNLSDQKVVIPRSVWSEEDMHLHSGEASLGRWETNSGPNTPGSEIKARFRNVEFVVPVNNMEPANTDPRVEAPAQTKDKGGSKENPLWPKAHDRVLVRVFESGAPKSKAELVRWYINAFEDIDPNSVPDDSTIRKRLKKIRPKSYEKAGVQRGE
jgi:hypothetical protein